MAYDIKPTEKPHFCTVVRNEAIPNFPVEVPNVTPPTPDEVLYGDAFGVIPSRDRDNYLRRSYDQWIDVLDQWTQENKTLIEANAEEIIINAYDIDTNALDISNLDTRVDTLETDLSTLLVRITGTTNASGFDTILSYPSGYTLANTIPVSGKLENSPGIHRGIGYEGIVGDRPVGLFLTNLGIGIQYEDDVSNHNVPFSILIMKMS